MTKLFLSPVQQHQHCWVILSLLQGLCWKLFKHIAQISVLNLITYQTHDFPFRSGNFKNMRFSSQSRIKSQVGKKSRLNRWLHLQKFLTFDYLLLMPTYHHFNFNEARLLHLNIYLCKRKRTVLKSNKDKWCFLWWKRNEKKFISIHNWNFFLGLMFLLRRTTLKPIESHENVWENHLALNNLVNLELGSHIRKKMLTDMLVFYCIVLFSFFKLICWMQWFRG